MDWINEIKTTVKRCTNLCANKSIRDIDPINNFDMIHQLVPSISNYCYLFDMEGNRQDIELKECALRDWEERVLKSTPQKEMTPQELGDFEKQTNIRQEEIDSLVFDDFDQQIDSLYQMAKAINKYIDNNFIGDDLNSLSLFNSFLKRANSICVWEKIK